MDPIFEVKVIFILIFSFCTFGGAFSLLVFYSKLEEERKQEKKGQRDSALFFIFGISFFLILVFFIIYVVIPEDSILRERFVPSTPQKTIFSAEVEKGRWLVKLEEPNGRSHFYFISKNPPKEFLYKNGETFINSVSLPKISKISSASPAISK